MRNALLSLPLLLVACKDKDPGPDPDTVPVGEGLFAEGCPVSGQALARVIGVDATLPGDVAVGTAGDLLLASTQAAFVITEPDKGSTYYYYGGIVADAVPMDGCTPGEDRLDEVALILGRLDIFDVTASILRGFRGEHIEVVADGADGGPATVRVTGVDDTHWLVEYTLMAEAAAGDGDGRAFSEALGVSVTVDYTLMPDSPVLQIDVTATNTSDQDVSLFSAALLSFGETMDIYAYPSSEIALSGFSFGLGVPWLLATDGESALAYGVLDGNLAYESISGIDVAVDLVHALSEPFDLSPGQSGTRSSLLSVGAGDGPSATGPLSEANPEPLPAQPYTLSPVSGTVVDSDGEPVPDARIALQARAPGAEWGTLDLAVADTSGGFVVPVLVFAAPWDWRLVASAPGRDSSDPVEISPGEAGVTLALSAAGSLSHRFTDDLGDPIPVRLHLRRAADGAEQDLFLRPEGVAPVAPGTYAYTATRGFEYASATGTLEIQGGAAGAAGETLALSLAKVVDTAGYLSVDTHVHTSASPDSRVNPAVQLLHAAAHGLEVVVHTEHEIIVDTSGIPAEAGLSDWITSVNGEEVTATIPEHMTMFPAESDGTVRGGIVSWYGMDIDDLFAEMRDRSGGGINLLNHPSYMDLIGWDRISAAPTLSDPTRLGLAPDAALWSWNFDGVEVMNGTGSPFRDGNRRFDNWQSMINAGYPRIAVGCSDAHGGDDVGFPRTYFASSTDDPAQLVVDDLLTAFLEGDAVSSAGAFARVSVEGAPPGALITDTDGEVLLDVHIEAIPAIDVTHIIVTANCDQVLSVAADDPGGVVKFSEVLAVPVSGDTNLVVMAFGKDLLPAGLPQYDGARTPRVLTNPIYIDGDGDGLFSAPGGRECSYDLLPPASAR